MYKKMITYNIINIINEGSYIIRFAYGITSI